MVKSSDDDNGYGDFFHRYRISAIYNLTVRSVSSRFRNDDMKQEDLETLLTRLDATTHGVWSGATLFAFHYGYLKNCYCSYNQSREWSVKAKGVRTVSFHTKCDLNVHPISLRW